MTTKRKPYQREISASWWKKHAFFRFYMLREGTAIFAIWFSLVLMYGLYCMQNGVFGFLDYIQFLKNPIVLLLNLVSLAAALLHTKTWFELAPKAANLIIKGKKVTSDAIVKVLWAVTVVASLLILLLIFL